MPTTELRQSPWFLKPGETKERQPLSLQSSAVSARIWNERVTGVAAASVSVPGWLAITVHTPAAATVTVDPLIEQGPLAV